MLRDARDLADFFLGREITGGKTTKDLVDQNFFTKQAAVRRGTQAVTGENSLEPFLREFAVFAETFVIENDAINQSLSSTKATPGCHLTKKLALDQRVKNRPA